MVSSYPPSMLVAFPAGRYCPIGYYLGPSCACSFPRLECLPCPEGLTNGAPNSLFCDIVLELLPPLPCPPGFWGTSPTNCTACTAAHPCGPVDEKVYIEPSYRPSQEPPNTVPETIAIITTAIAVTAVGVTTTTIGFCCLGVSSLLIATAAVLQGIDVMFSEQHSSPVPGPVISRKTSLGGLFFLLAMLTFAGLTIFLVFDYLNTTTSSATLLPSGYPGVAANPSFGPRIQVNVTLYALSGGPCVCSAAVFWVGVDSNSSCQALAEESTCLLAFDSGSNTSIFREAMIFLGTPAPTSAAAMSYSIRTTPHYLEPDGTLISQGIASPIGGPVPVKVNTSLTWISYSDAAGSESTGWYMGLDSVESAAATQSSSSFGSVGFQLWVIRPPNTLKIQEERSESIAMLFASIFSFMIPVWLICSVLVSCCEQGARDLRDEKDPWPREVERFQELYERETGVKAQEPKHPLRCCRGCFKKGKRQEELADIPIHDAFHKSTVHLPVE